VSYRGLFGLWLWTVKSEMTPNTQVPKIDSRYICIADRDSVVLASTISSYLFRPGGYLPLFLFPPVRAPQSDADGPWSDSYLSNLIGNQKAIFINNAWARMGGSVPIPVEK